jgi:2'-hydroxyisoflavone reductase
LRTLARMRILVLGGTRFVGRHLVEAARAGGHTVAVFNRGRTPLPWVEVEHLAGDRERGDLRSLSGREWDVCLDVNGYLPQHVQASAELLREHVALYAFVSTASVYALPGTPPIDETGALHPAPAARVDAVAPELYGPLKVACEQEVERAFPRRALILRPGIVAGPYDSTNRFTWWVERVARGGELLAPGAPSSPVQLVDGRDLAQFATCLVSARVTGTFNVCGAPSSFGELIAACAAGTGSDAKPTWVSEQLLLAEGIEPFDDLPLWLPDEPEGRASDALSNARARAAGLVLRPLAETARDTWEWLRAVRAGELPAPTLAGFVARGLNAARETAIIRSSHSG